LTVYYLDTSALVKRYVQEVGTNWVMSITDPVANHDLYVVRITGPEMIAAFFRKVRTQEMTNVTPYEPPRISRLTLPTNIKSWKLLQNLQTVL
jgi:hypothetical protein